MSTAAKGPGEGRGRGVVPAEYTAGTKFAGTDNLRHLRVLQALRVRALPRQTLDAVAGCSNGPDLVAALRRLGLDVPCTRIEAVDRDGLPCVKRHQKLTPWRHPELPPQAGC